MKILLIEDNRLLAHLISTTYSNEKISTASCLKDGIDLLNRYQFNLIFVDLGLPDSSGIETLKFLDLYKVPKVVITANLSLTSEAAKLGVADYIIKNGNFEDVVARITFNIEKYRPKRYVLQSDIFDQIKFHMDNPKLTPAY